MTSYFLPSPKRRLFDRTPVSCHCQITLTIHRHGPHLGFNRLYQQDLLTCYARIFSVIYIIAW